MSAEARDLIYLAIIGLAGCATVCVAVWLDWLDHRADARAAGRNLDLTEKWQAELMRQRLMDEPLVDPRLIGPR